jgi:DNA-binding response OmpR family regulator
MSGTDHKIPTVLIVEDDDNDFMFLELALVAEKFEANIRHVCDGEEAIEYLSGENDFANRDLYPMPKLMVLDVKMPRKNGFEVLAWLRQHAALATLPVIIFSSSGQPADVKRAYDLGATAYLVKPSSYLSYSEVVQTIKHFLPQSGGQPPEGQDVRTFPNRLR